MYFKKLELLGFKTFADRLELEFAPGLTCVVGPNGSGKSNVMDALRFCLGEQSVRDLRGSHLIEVIFSGSDFKRPTGMAQVDVTLDNSCGTLPVDFTEVVITRRVFRSGESEFAINKIPCRLRDITELLMGTGIGRDTYSFISQGKVDEIISSRPEERRVLFEEAAGISKFKHRKKEALRRLEGAFHNVLRLKDILSELDSQLASLKRQADRARRYQRVQEELSGLEIQLKGKQIAVWKEALKQHDEGKQALQCKIQNARDEFEMSSGTLAELRSRLRERETHQETLQVTLRETLREEQAVISRQILSEQKILMLSEKEQALLSEMDACDETVKAQHFKQEELLEKFRLAENSRVDIEKKQADLQKALEEAERFRAEISESLDKVRLHLFEKNRDLAGIQNEVLFLRKEVQRAGNDLQEVEQRLRNKEEEGGKLELSIQEMEAQVQKRKIHVEGMESRLRFKEYQKEHLELEQQSLETRLSELKIERSKYSEYPDPLSGRGAFTSNALMEHFSGLEGEVQSLVQMPPHLQAVQGALSAKLSCLVLQNEEILQEIAQHFREGQAGKALLYVRNLFPEVSAKDIPFHPQVLGRISDFLTGDETVARLFSDVLLVDHFHTAQEIVKTFPGEWVVVTLDGECIFKDGTVLLGKDSPDAAFLDKEIERFSERLKMVAQDMKDLNTAWEKTFQEVKSEETLLPYLERDAEAKKKEKEESAVEIRFLQDERQLAKNEHLQIAKKLEQTSENLNAARQEEKQLSDFLSQIQDEETAQAGKQKALQEAKNVLFEEKLKLEQELKNLHSSETQIQEHVTHALDMKEKKSEIMKRISDEKQNLEEEKTQLEQSLADLRRRLEDAEKQIGSWTQDKTDFHAQIEQLEDKLQHFQTSIAEYREIQHGTELKMQEVEMKLEEAFRHLEQEYGLSGEDSLSLQEMQELDVQEAEQRVLRLRQSLKNMGPVNMESVEEYERTCARHTFLKRQEQDMEESSELLHKMLREIDREVKKAFLKTFEEVGEHFQYLFERLFGGGNVRLVLLEDEQSRNPLEAGVDIEVQLPGKRSQNIMLLSGGQKTLVAISLLFAFLRAKPTPFCILDEVDAALDDANVEKFNLLLNEFKDNTQFIVITHNKLTMEAADVLYGVTMEEGVSRVVSVRLAASGESRPQSGREEAVEQVV